MRKLFIFFAAVLFVAVVSTPDAHAWRNVRTGKSNFERAWSAFMFKRPEKAKPYFVEAADAFGQALAENPPSRTALFPSNLTMAGISSYYAGRYEQSLAAMQRATDKDDSIWEAYIYSALAQARQGDKAKTVESLKAYIRSNPSQSILSSEVQRQITDLETDSASLEKVITPLEDALSRQFHNNVIFVGPRADNPSELCSGPFWWRNNRKPCEHDMYYNNW
ncbi:tetratricopeptide repeat protein [Pseudodesulfovibrio sp.]|uniref:tetratricopeptide repeat protein n=1 Tax=unclassified Pseudodesulfovibrio TaxID=2661612 RepID=UPI003B00DB8B